MGYSQLNEGHRFAYGKKERERGRGRWVSETGSFVIAGKMLIESDALIATHTSHGPVPRSLDVC